jgi:protoheme IX farnesyltransferase
MNKVEMLHSRNVGKTAVFNKLNVSTIVSDLKALVKAPVLIANVLPVFTGFWLALYFTGASLQAYWDICMLAIAGSTLVMAGALVLNNWYDFDIDRIMERTKHRPTVTGHFSLRVVLAIGVSFTVVGLVLLLYISVESAVYALVGWFAYVILYTMWSKRRYTLNTIVGSVSGAVTPLIGWAAVEPAFHTVPIMLFLILFIWQIPHTFAIAMKKCEEYKAAGVAMFPVVHGFAMTKRQIVIYIACLLPFPFYLAQLGTAFVVLSVLLTAGWLIAGISGFFMKNDLIWAHIIFIYSVNYITILLLLMVLVTII